MDRRQQLALTLAVCGTLSVARAQEATPAPSPSPSPAAQPSVAPGAATTPAASAPPAKFPAPGQPFPGGPNRLPPRPLGGGFNRPPGPGPGPESRANNDPKIERKMEARRDEELRDDPQGTVMDRLKDRREKEMVQPKPNKDLKEPKGPKQGNGPGASLEDMLERMPPDEARRIFQDNIQRWRELPPEERQALRQQQGQRADRIQEEVDGVLRDSGLKLDDDQREVFRLRYIQERRKLERTLREQMESERAKRLPQIVDQLKREFNRPLPPAPRKGPPPQPPAQQAPSVAPSPAANPAPPVSVAPTPEPKKMMPVPLAPAATS